MARDLVARAAAGEDLDDPAWAALLGADGGELEELAAAADAVRRERVGDAVTFVANRNLDTAVVAAPGADPALVGRLVAEAWALGATEICLQGPLPDGSAFGQYADLVRAVRSAAPLVHLHAFRPPEVAHAARLAGTTPAAFLAAAREAGLGSVPGTAAQVLDDGVRRAFAGPGPAPMPAAAWVDLVTAAHRAGLRSTATLLYGHVETPAQVVAHLRTLAAIQDDTGGFTELIAMPLLPRHAPAHLADAVGAGPSRRRTRAVHAVARLLLRGRIDHVQAAWTKLEPDLVVDLLRGGADDLGGLLLDGTLDPGAGQEAGLQLTTADLARIAGAAGRPLRQRTTTYGSPSPERLDALRGRLS